MTLDKQQRALLAILQERARQDSLLRDGVFVWDYSDPKETGPIRDYERATALTEEVGEVAHAALECWRRGGPQEKANLREELVQVAALALAWLEALP